MSFVVRGLSADPYRHLFGLSDEELARHGAYRYVATSSPGFPDRVEMRDAEVGESLILINHVTVEADTPYKTSHAIFVLEGATQPYEAVDEVPDVMARRLLSLRAFDANGMMVDAKLAEGAAIKPAIEALFENEKATHIDAHYALRGCFSARIERGREDLSRR